MDKEKKIKSAIEKTIRYMNCNYYSKFEEKNDYWLLGRST